VGTGVLGDNVHTNLIEYLATLTDAQKRAFTDAILKALLETEFNAVEDWITNTVGASLGLPYATALSTGTIDPADTNVHAITTFNSLPANSYVFMMVHLYSATTAGRYVKIWQDSGGTIPGIGTDNVTTGRLFSCPTTTTAAIGHFLIKLDASGNFYYSVNNADVNELSFTSIIYFHT